MNRPGLEAFADPAALAAAAAGDIAESLEDALRRRGAAVFAGAGGRTPGPIYEALSMAPIGWDRVTVTLADERWVDATSPDSNERLMRETLLKGRAAAAAFLPLKNGARTPEEGAREADRALRAAGGGPDVVLLGMGEDGHFASLFPGSPALAEGLAPADGALCVAAPAGEPAPPQARLSLTLPAIAGASRVLLAITGEAKRQVYDRALAGENLPIRAVIEKARGLRAMWAP